MTAPSEAGDSRSLWRLSTDTATVPGGPAHAIHPRGDRGCLGVHAPSRAGLRDVEAIDDHATLNDCLAHLFKLAEEDAPAYVYAHWLDGRAEPMGDVDSE